MITAGTFVFCLIVFTGIGVASSLRKKQTTEDYLLAGRDVNPWLAALSAVATNNSGFMFIAHIGFAFTVGLSSVWMMIGWILGDLAVWLWVHKRVRLYSGQVGARSVPEFIGGRSDGSINRTVVTIAGLFTFFFLGGYAAAQLSAGGKALHALFSWPEEVGVIAGATVVLVYCYSGGLRASIWTDAAQSVVMLVAMAAMLILSAVKVGGPVSLISHLEALDPELVSWMPGNLKMGFGLYFLGMVAGGFGAIGAPHILIRTMSIRSPEEIDRARGIYFAWFVPFFVAATLVGLYARVLLPELDVKFAEHAMPELAKDVLHPAMLGLTLAGLFSATMSTADSQLLSCSAAVTHDVFPRWSSSYLASKAATVGITLLAVTIALVSDDSVFDLVLMSWSLLGTSLGPLLILRIARLPVSTSVAVLMMIAGPATVLFWSHHGLSDHVFQMLPGLLAAFAVYGIGTLKK